MKHFDWHGCDTVNRLPALRKVQICPKLVETKRKNIFWTIWTAGFVWAAEDIGYINLTKISPKVPILSYFGIHSLLQEPKYHLISLPHSKSSQKRYKMANICIKCTNWVIFGLILSQNSAYFMLLLWKYCIWYMIHDTWYMIHQEVQTSELTIVPRTVIYCHLIILSVYFSHFRVGTFPGKWKPPSVTVIVCFGKQQVRHACLDKPASDE